MDTITVILEGMRVILGLLMLLFVPGFAISLVIFPRFTDLGLIERLAYSTVLSIGSVIALVLFMDVFLGVDTTPVNIIIVIAAFSFFVFFEWLCEVWYLNSRLKERLEPRLSADYKALQKYYSRETNAARDRFRKDIRTVVVYHEHLQSGLNLIDHSYLMDVGEEISIQQVAENKVKVTDSVILQPPYQRTRYFELVIREYNENGLSLVDDLQIYPALVTKKPDRRFLGFVLQRGTTHITERLHKKTSTAEVQWIYSHDFHIFAIVHAEDTLDMMVDRILGKLDEITISMKSGIHLSSHIEDRQILRDAFDAAIEKPRETPVNLLEIAQEPEGQFSAGPKESPKHPVIQPRVEPREIPRSPVVLTGGEPKERPKWPVIQTTVESEQIMMPPEVQFSVEPKEIFKQVTIQRRVEPREILKGPKVPISNDPKAREQRKLQNEILRDLDVFSITPDSFGKSKKNIENIIIPKKSDVPKKLADVEEEVKDLDWLYE